MKRTCRALICACVLALSPVVQAQVPEISQACLDAIGADAFGATGIYAKVVPFSGLQQGVTVDGRVRYAKGYFVSNYNVPGQGPGLTTALFTHGAVQDALAAGHADEFTDSAVANCDPYVLGYLLGIAIHETFHADSVCGPAEDDPETEDVDEGACTHLAINIKTADTLCSEAAELASCLPECPQEVKDKLDGMCARIGEMQDRFNDPANGHTDKAADCAAGWTPPTANCPSIPSPPAGDPPHDNWPIPGCGSCPEEEEEG